MNKLLNRLICLLMCAALLAAVYVPAFAQTLTPGEKSEAVSEAKLRLYELKYYATRKAGKTYDDAMREHLMDFQRVNGLEEMIAETFTQPSGDDAGRWWTVSEICQRLQERYRSQEIRNSSLATIGRTLSLPRFHFESKRRPQGMVYKLAER